ncbi:MAG TPA: low temperature requirement protein A [Gaiellaceae bacterium]|nr:low temperature requirement protein A [Gaiellaceae bacterium]
MTSIEQLARPASEAEGERRTSYLELFFDLVFVFAITQVTAVLVEDTSAAGFGRAALLLGLVWWAWGGYAWMTNAIDVESILVRSAMIAAAAGAFFMALAVPQAYGEDGIWFATAYLGIRVLHVALYVWGLRGDRAHQRAVLKLAPWFLVAPVVAFAGGLAEGDLRVLLWAVSLAIDVLGALNVAGAGFRVSPSHFAERYALFMIIALGESVVAVGAGAAELPRDATFVAAVAIAFGGVAAMWWAYFDFTALAAERALRFASEERRGPLARDVFSIFHFPTVLGIIFYAVAAKKTIAHPHDPLSQGGRVALGLGIALYLLGPVLGRFRITGHVSWDRLVGGAAAVAVALALDGVDALWVLAVVIGVLVLTSLHELRRLGEARRRIRAEEAHAAH